MSVESIARALTFLKEAEKLKDVMRTAYTSSGRRESTAAHTWRLCLMAMVFERDFAADGAPLDFAKLLKICVLHDLGEAINGDIPATLQRPDQGKATQEREDLQTLLAPLDAELQAQFLALWDEYENGASKEARLVKGLDKLETILQHNQGRNPADFDYAFNLTYGQKHTSNHPLFVAIRTLLDEETRRNAAQRGQG